MAWQASFFKRLILIEKDTERRLSRHSQAEGGRRRTYIKIPSNLFSMFYVYIINSLVDTGRMYVGLTNNVENRLNEHNTGECIYTNRYRPWQLCTTIGFATKEKAVAFERYLKSGSGRVFAK